MLQLLLQVWSLLELGAQIESGLHTSLTCLISKPLSPLTWFSFSSVAQLYLTLCNPMDCSMPGFPVNHQFPEFTQTYVHSTSDAIQPFHPLSSPSPAFNLSQNLSLQYFPRVFSNESVLPIKWPTYWSFRFSFSPSNEYSGLISFRMAWLDLLAVQGTLKSLLQHHGSNSSSTLQCSSFFIV